SLAHGGRGARRAVSRSDRDAPRAADGRGGARRGRAGAGSREPARPAYADAGRADRRAERRGGPPASVLRGRGPGDREAGGRARGDGADCGRGHDDRWRRGARRGGGDCAGRGAGGGAVAHARRNGGVRRVTALEPLARWTDHAAVRAGGGRPGAGQRMAGDGGRDPARPQQRGASEPVRPVLLVGRRTGWGVATRSRGGGFGARWSHLYRDPRAPRLADRGDLRRARWRYGRWRLRAGPRRRRAAARYRGRV